MVKVHLLKGDWVCIDLIFDSIDKVNAFDVIMDFSKTADKIPHGKIVTKIKVDEIQERVSNWM